MAARLQSLEVGGSMKPHFGLHILVLILSLYSVSCAKRTARRALFQAGVGYCSNPKLGEFDVVLTADKGTPGLFALQVVTVSVAQAGGQYVRVALANSNLEYEEIVVAALIRPNEVLYEGFVTPQQLQVYDLIVMAPYRGGQGTIMSSQSQDDEAICQLPTRDTTGTTGTNPDAI